ncbi:hypothetical protein EZV62_004218 [Acer yangbiense]|uniref:NB-ARC domain-containing protein n=1 Tax=Acer yangbiense TaxID=1000413 RepID=A0A5C7IJ35_9ROSI|nr:hypothetical protein EZV62_004218 [Acer yangbiense]
MPQKYFSLVAVIEELGKVFTLEDLQATLKAYEAKINLLNPQPRQPDQALKYEVSSSEGRGSYNNRGRDAMRNKFDDKSEKCIFIGYSEKSKAYKLFNPKTKKIVISRDVRVDEDLSFDEKRDPVKLPDFVDEENEESDYSSQPSSGDFSPKIKMKSLQEIYNSTEQVETDDSIFFAFFAGLKLSKNGEGKLVDSTLFRNLVGNLIFLIATRSDIMYAVSLISRFIEKSFSNHWEAAKRILRYVRGMLDHVSKDSVLHGRTKHIRMRFHFLRELVNERLVDVKYCKSEEQVADIFTKPLGGHVFKRNLERKMQEEGLDFQTTRNADHYGALINHLSLIRNKRCLMAYQLYDYAGITKQKYISARLVGLRLFELPEEIQGKLSHPEKEYFKKHSSALESYMSKVDLDLNVLEDNLVRLQSELQKLIHTRNDVLRRVIVDEQPLKMKRTDLVQGWLSRVQAAENHVEELQLLKDEQTQKLCLGGYCSTNCKSSYKFGKRVYKMLQVVTTSKSEGDFKNVAEKMPEDPVDEMPIHPTIVGLQSTFDKVWTCLGDEQVGIIGLYGMGGVGKTTLLTQINNNFLDTTNGFDVVIWVVVSKDKKLEMIQETIGKKIVGVPLPSTKISSKIVFTTRFNDVCGHMEAHKQFRVECLAHEEAWKLFRMKVGRETLDNDPDILQVAQLVAKECGGLPLALITIGRAMACKKTVEEWNHAIQVLKESAFKFSACEIEKEKRKFLVQTSVGLTEAPETEKWEGVKRMSLMGNRIENLFEIPSCPNLSTLFLNKNSLHMINNDFFRFMPSLKVLNLSSNGLIEFPLGISRLVSLQHLNLSLTGIKELPDELKALTNLRCLNLGNMYNLHRVPQRLISSFAKLRIFRLSNWNLGPVGNNVLSGDGEYLVEELLCLKYLKALSIHLKGSCALGKFLKSQKLHSCTRFLHLEGLEESLAVLSLTVSIRGCIKLRDATWLVFAPNLKNIGIEFCGYMEEVISVEKCGQVKEEIESLNPFAKLEYLKLHNLRRLKSICWKPLPFPHLKEMKVFWCPSLEKLPLDFNIVKERKIVMQLELRR